MLRALRAARTRRRARAAQRRARAAAIGSVRRFIAAPSVRRACAPRSHAAPMVRRLRSRAATPDQLQYYRRSPSATTRAARRARFRAARPGSYSGRLRSGTPRQRQRFVVRAVAIERQRQPEQRALARFVVRHRFAVGHDRASQLGRALGLQRSASIAIACVRAAVSRLCASSRSSALCRQLRPRHARGAERECKSIRSDAASSASGSRRSAVSNAATASAWRPSADSARPRSASPVGHQCSARSPRRLRSGELGAVCRRALRARAAGACDVRRARDSVLRPRNPRPAPSRSPRRVGRTRARNVSPRS